MASRKKAPWGLALACAGVLLAGCGGGGGGNATGDKGGTTVGNCAPPGNATGAKVLFGADANNGTLAAFNTLTPSCEAWADHVFATVDGFANGIAYDAGRDALYVAVAWLDGRQEVDVYAQASALGAGATPARTITLSNFTVVRAIALDTVHDRLWVGGERTTWAADGGEVDVYESGSTRSGAALAERQIRDIPGIINMALDTTHSILYTVGGADNGVVAFADANALASGTGPTFEIAGSAGSFGIAVDGARDIAYLPNPVTGLKIVRNASSGASASAVNVPFAGTKTLTASVDSTNDRLYLGAYSDAYVIDHASALTASSAIPAPAANAASAVVIAGFAMP